MPAFAAGVGCIASTGSAGHAPAGATTDAELTFRLDHGGTDQ